MRSLMCLIDALILGGSVGTKFVFGSSLVRRQSVVNGGWPLWEKVSAAESEVHTCLTQRKRDGGEGRDDDGSERLCNNRVHRPAVAGQEEGRPCGICATRDVDDLTDGATLLGKGAYRMLIHIFWGIDEAGIGPAGPRCVASP